MKYLAPAVIALLLGFLLGRWTPTQELRRVHAELARRPAEPAASSVAASARDFLKIEAAARAAAPGPARDTRQDAPEEPAPEPPAPAGDTNAAPASVAAADPVDRREQAAAALESAKELWQVRSDVARTSFLENIEAEEDGAARFDVVVASMNLRLEDVIATWVAEVKPRGEPTPEDGVRLIHDLSGAVVLTYDELDRGLPEGWREKAGAGFQLFDFVDPGVAEPLIEIEPPAGAAFPADGPRPLGAALNPGPASSLWVTAWYECLDSVRSRRAIVLTLLYFAGAMMGANGFVKVVAQIEEQVLETLRVSSTSSVGAVAQTLWQTEMFLHLVERMTGSKALAAHLTGTSPIALFYAAVSFLFAPLLMMLIATTRIAEDVGSGAARFALFRSRLFPWCGGKFVGQALLLIPALLLSAAGAWLIGYFRLATFQPWSTAVSLLGYSLKALVYTWSWLGLAIGVSQVTRSPNLATIFGFLGLVVLSILSGLSRWFLARGGAPAWELLRWLTPQGHRMDLWWPDPAHYVPAVVVLLALGVLYMLPGYLLMRRADH